MIEYHNKDSGGFSMMWTKEIVYMYLIIGFSLLSTILFFIVILAKKAIGMKFKSFFAKKSGKLLIKYTDKTKGYYEFFAKPTEDYNLDININGKDKLLSINPNHIYFDNMYYMRAVNLNDRGSYLVHIETKLNPDTGEKEDVTLHEQDHLNAETADRLYKSILLAPQIQNDLQKLLKIIIIIVCVVGLIGIVSLFIQYKNYQTLDALKILIESNVAATGGVL